MRAFLDACMHACVHAGCVCVSVYACLWVADIQGVPKNWPFYLKGEIHSSEWSTRTFCTISGSRDISKTMWGIRFKEFEIINNLISDTDEI